jgi:tetratricopeptide (TPR) repeat protein
LSGYDDENGHFIAQDSLVMADLKAPYQDIEERWWRDFNYVYLVVYPAEREAEVYAILGPEADETANFQHALQKAMDEIPLLKGRDLFFAWYNLGTNRVALGDYTGAAMAYDQAFALYQGLAEADRPYRMLWYQVGPYPAYYHTGSYQDVINLANTTFAWVGEPVLEETYYWRAMAHMSLGEADQAIADFKKAARLNPNSTEALEMLKSLGVDFP